VLSWAVRAVAKAGTVLIIGDYPQTDRTFPIGEAMNRNLVLRMGNCNHRAITPHLIELARNGSVDPLGVLTQREPVAEAIEACHTFDRRQPGWMKVKLERRRFECGAGQSSSASAKPRHDSCAAAQWNMSRAVRCTSRRPFVQPTDVPAIGCSRARELLDGWRATSLCATPAFSYLRRYLMNDTQRPMPPFEGQQQDRTPGRTAEMQPQPDHGEKSYRGSGRLAGKAAIITGGDSGIGRAVAIAFAREGADVLIAYLDEDDDARETSRWIEEAGRKAVLVPGDIADPAHCNEIVNRAMEGFGRLDVLVNNAAYQMTYPSLEAITDEEWDKTFDINIGAMFRITRAAVRHMKPGAAIINTTSVNADHPNPGLIAYATTKGAIQNFTGGLAQLLAEKGIRSNCVAPGPIWTPLIPSTMPPEKVEKFGQQVPMKRPGQPAELAPAYVMLASDEASYISGATIAVTGGSPII
jgi:NAD(P)-dependent dehydrogenase (short-subunit alcohol dehydrogenase family)